jgi:energy-coupling factor transport system ATP-binding protein
MIRIEKLTYRYPGAEKNALHIPSLQIQAGTFCLVIGESGSGKSTLLRLINGLVPHFTGGTLGGNIQVAGLNPVAAGPQVMSRQVGFVFQEAENQFVVDIVEDEIAFSMEQAAIPRAEMQTRVQQILQTLNLEHLRTRKVDTLSGGETQRVAIAAALVLEPKILVLDEPTSQLDPLAAEEVMLLLKRLQQDLGLTIVLSEQRLDRVLGFADCVAILSADGQLSEYGLPQEVIQHSVLKPPIVQLAEINGWYPIPLDVDQAKKFVQPEIRMPVRETPSTAIAQPLLEVQHVHVNLGKRMVLQDINFTLNTQERLVIMGPNGAGKSTLLRTLMGLIAPDQGEIIFKGKKVAFQGTAQLSHQIGFLPQDPNALLFSETVQEELETTLRNHHIPLQSEVVERLLSQLNIQSKAHAYPRDLSTGEKQRVALGAVVVTQPELIILDEPTRGLDQITKNALLTLLLDWNHNGKTILLVTHDVEFAAAFASRILIIEDGKMIDQGDPREIMRIHPRYTPQIARLYPDTNWLTLNDLLE